MYNAKIVLSFLVIGALAGCSSSSSPAATDGGAAGGDSGSGGGNGTVKIDSPATGSSQAMNNGIVDVAFTVTNFTLKNPGSCGTATNCGHIHVLIDGTACNDTAGGVPYNVAAIASPAQPNFHLCPTAAGSHSITLELHNDDHSPYQVNGATVSDQIQITTTGT